MFWPHTGQGRCYYGRHLLAVVAALFDCTGRKRWPVAGTLLFAVMANTAGQRRGHEHGSEGAGRSYNVEMCKEWEDVSSAGKSFVMQLLCPKPWERLSVDGALSHAWLGLESRCCDSHEE